MKILFLSICLFLSTALLAEKNKWVLLEKENKIQLYSGTKDINDIYPYKARVWVPFTIPEIFAVFIDTKRKHQWIPRLKTSWAEDVPNNKASRIEYAEVLMPFPFDNREVLVQVDTIIEGSLDKIRLHCRSVQNDRIIKKGNIRALVYPSNLTLTWDETKKETLLEVVSFTDPQGYIPTWVVNLFQKSEALTMAQALIKQLKKKLYSDEEIERIRRNLKELK
ncbi:MAG: hypothetical protein ACJAT2_003280 [Bacteriovoracaceae bacterium]|jgi:hypothetical protein